MKALLIAALVLAAAPAVAQTTFYSNGATEQTIGNTTFYTGPRGQTGTAIQSGNTTFYSGAYGNGSATTIPAPAPIYTPPAYAPAPVYNPYRR